MDWFDLLLNVFMLTAMGTLQLGFVCSFTGKEKVMRHFVLYLLLLHACDRAAFMLDSDWFAFAAGSFIIYGMSRFALKNNRSVSCAASILSIHIQQLSFGLLTPLEMLFFPNAIGHTLLLSLLVALASLLSLAICLCCYGLILKRFTLQHGQQGTYIWLLLPQELFFYSVELYILNTAYDRVLTVPYPVEMGKQLTLLTLQILGLGALFCTLYAYRRTCDSFQSQASIALLKQETDAQKTYVAEAQMRYEQTRAFRHDIKNHLSVLEGLLKKGYTDQAQTYLRKLDTATGDLSFPIHTGNPVIDILLGDKLAFAKTAGVEAEVSLTLPQPCAAVDDFDLCVIFANAMDNAIRACMQADGPKKIRISGERQGDFYRLEFENTCACEPAKEQVIGTGLSNVKAVAEKYGGATAIERFPSLFCLNVLLDIS